MDTKKFTIKDLERFSGIKAHTLRAWEHRYALLKPDRTSNNFRLYNLDQLKKILDIALLKKNGHRISALATTLEVEDKLRLLRYDDDKWQKAVNDLTVSMYLQNNEIFEAVLDKFLLYWPIETLIEQVLFPFLKMTNLLWIGHKLFEEHMAVTAVRKKLILGIESVKSCPKTDKTVLLFLPDTKQLDLGLLYAYFFLKRRGGHICYLGNDVTIQNLKSLLPIHPQSFLFTYLPQNHHFPIEDLISFMNVNTSHSKLIIGDYSIEKPAPVFNDNLIKMGYTDAVKFLFESCI